jgi:hypothetical protein
MKPIPYKFQLIVVFLIMGLLWAGTLAAADRTTPANATDTDTAAAMTARWGITVASIHTAAAGNMVDFRYKVIDAQKASALFDKKTSPYLIHEKTGKVLAVPRTAKVGPLMSSYHPKENRTYWMFFGNQTKLVKPGDVVSVVIGDFKAEHLYVQ